MRTIRNVGGVKKKKRKKKKRKKREKKGKRVEGHGDVVAWKNSLAVGTFV